jgi:hypothetical protein
MCTIGPCILVWVLNMSVSGQVKKRTKATDGDDGVSSPRHIHASIEQKLKPVPEASRFQLSSWLIYVRLTFPSL